MSLALTGQAARVLPRLQPAGTGRWGTHSAAGPCEVAGLGQGRLGWATDSGGGEGHPSAKAGSRVHIRARRFARSGQSVPQHQQAEGGAQFLDGRRGRRGAALGCKPNAGPGHHCPQPPGIAPSPSEVDAGRGEPTGAGGPSHQRSAHGPAVRRGAKPRRPKPQARETQSRRALRRPKAKPKPVARPATRGEWVSRAWSGARSAERKAWGAPASGDTAASRRPSYRPTVQGGER